MTIPHLIPFLDFGEAAREMVSRLVADLSNCGYVAVENRRIVVLKPLPER